MCERQYLSPPSSDTAIFALAMYCKDHGFHDGWRPVIDVTFGATESLTLATFVATLLKVEDRAIHDDSTIPDDGMWLFAAQYESGARDVIGVDWNGSAYVLHWSACTNQTLGFHRDMILTEYLDAEVRRHHR